MPAGAPFGVRQHVDLYKPCLFDPLEHQLGYPIPTLELDRVAKIVIDDDDLDLAPIPGIDGARRVDQAQPSSCSQPRPGVDERRVAVRERYRYPGRKDGSLAGRHRQVLGGHDIGAGVPRQGVGGQRQVSVQSLDEHLERHGRKGTLDLVTDRSARPNSGSSAAVYREHLRTPYVWYAVALFVAALLAAEFHIGKYALTDWIPFGTLLPLSVIFVWLFGRSYLEIRDGELRIRGAHIPLSEISGAVALDAETLRRVVGREGDPAAFVSIRPWIGPGVQVWIDDPEDPTPYWVISSRTPQQVVDILRAQDR